MSNVNDILKKLDNLNNEELQRVSEKLLRMLQEASGVACVEDNSVDACRKCGSKHIVKFGKDKNGKQRFRCKSCGATFTITSYSVVSNSHCSLNTWERYLGLLLEGCSLAECAAKCSISVRTAFIWRHKILNALQKDQVAREMRGIIETDEAYISISYKGNHSKSKKFVMPRESFKRGSDNRSRIGSKACVFCALERNGQAYGEVLGKGQPTIAMLVHAFENRIMSDSIVISDKCVSTKKYFETKEGIELVQLVSHVNPKSVASPPEVKGAYHIQNVNNFHNRLRRFLRPYNGVSTKYLNHYISLFVWIENYKKHKKHSIIEKTKKYICSADMYVSSRALFGLPAIPSPCAA